MYRIRFTRYTLAMGDDKIHTNKKLFELLVFPENMH